MLDLVKRGEPLEKGFTVRAIRLNIDVRRYTGADIQAIRKKLNASQALLAVFLGVSERAVAQWEQGERKPPLIVRRYLDDISEFPELWKKRLKSVKSVRVGERTR